LSILHHTFVTDPTSTTFIKLIFQNHLQPSISPISFPNNHHGQQRGHRRLRSLHQQHRPP
jgi:hypothetical protein